MVMQADGQEVTDLTKDKIDQLPKARVREIHADNTHATTNPLDLLLNADVSLVEQAEYYLERLGITFMIRNLTDDEQDEIQKRNRRFLQHQGNLTQDIDGHRMMRLVIAKCTISPSWNDPRMIDKYHSAEEAIGAILRPGEITHFSDTIMQLSGFKTDVQLTQEIKNS